MTTLKISPNFTMDDIRAIRTYNYEMTKNMTDAERDAYYDKKCRKAIDLFRKSRKKYIPAEENISIASEPQIPYTKKIIY